jgi:hypothetical protein
MSALERGINGPKQIAKGHEGVTAYRERYGQADLTVSLSRAAPVCHCTSEIVLFGKQRWHRG